MVNIDEIKIVLQNRNNYTRDEAILNLKFKYRPLNYYQCIVCAEYSLEYFLYSINWVINQIIPFDKKMINEFLEDFARNIIITDEYYSVQGLYDLTNFQNRIDQLNFDDIHDNFQNQYSIRMNDK